MLEPWITPSIFHNSPAGVVDEYTFSQNVSNARDILRAHWDNWVTLADFQKIADNGFNAVRIPIGKIALVRRIHLFQRLSGLQATGRSKSMRENPTSSIPNKLTWTAPLNGRAKPALKSGSTCTARRARRTVSTTPADSPTRPHGPAVTRLRRRRR